VVARPGNLCSPLPAHLCSSTIHPLLLLLFPDISLLLLWQASRSNTSSTSFISWLRNIGTSQTRRTAQSVRSSCLCLTLLLLLIDVVVPIPHPVGVARRAPDMPLFTPELQLAGLSNKSDPADSSRRATDPIPSAVPRVSFKVRRSSLQALYCSCQFD
jgi:hypothetical protein